MLISMLTLEGIWLVTLLTPSWFFREKLKCRQLIVNNKYIYIYSFIHSILPSVNHLSETSVWFEWLAECSFYIYLFDVYPWEIWFIIFILIKFFFLTISNHSESSKIQKKTRLFSNLSNNHMFIYFFSRPSLI